MVLWGAMRTCPQWNDHNCENSLKKHWSFWNFVLEAYSKWRKSYSRKNLLNLCNYSKSLCLLSPSSLPVLNRFLWDNSFAGVCGHKRETASLLSSVKEYSHSVEGAGQFYFLSPLALSCRGSIPGKYSQKVTGSFSPPSDYSGVVALPLVWQANISGALRPSFQLT